MSLYCAQGNIDADLTPHLQSLLSDALAKLGPRANVLAVPPDQSREQSRAGLLTRYAWDYYGDKLKAVLPAIGTHTPMRPDQLRPHVLRRAARVVSRVHHWRTGIETLGEIPAEYIYEQSEGKLSYAWPAQVNRLIAQGGFDLILSIGQVVPHEVVGMADSAPTLSWRRAGSKASIAAITWGRSTAWNASWAARKTRCATCSTWHRTASCDASPSSTCTLSWGAKLRAACAVRGLFVGDDVRVLPARSGAKPQGKLRNRRAAHPEGNRLSRST